VDAWTDEQEHQDADTPFARWLRAKIGNVPLREIQRRAKRRGIRIHATSLSVYLREGVFPERKTLVRLAAFFGVPVAELERLRPPPRVGEPPSLDSLLSGIEGVAAADRVRVALLARFYAQAGRVHELPTEAIRSVIEFVDALEDDGAARRGGVVGGEGAEAGDGGPP
jgi:hypothetical protein